MNLMVNSIKSISTSCRRVWVVVTCIFLPLMAVCADAGKLHIELQQLVSKYDAMVGIALITDRGDTVTVNNDEHYPLMSVMKLHQAVYVAHCLDSLGLDMGYEICVNKEDLKPNTYSPLRDRYPDGGITLTVGELLCYTLQHSDNNACDLLFDRFGRPAAVDAYVRSLGFAEFAISATEDDMHRDAELCHSNCSTPLEAARYIDWLYNGCYGGVNLQYVRQVLLDCRTGLQRIPAGVPADVKVAHKTGTSDCDALGRWVAVNDVAYVILPDGRNYSLVVFVGNAGEDFAAVEQLIANISREVYMSVKQSQ